MYRLRQFYVNEEIDQVHIWVKPLLLRVHNLNFGMKIDSQLHFHYTAMNQVRNKAIVVHSIDVLLVSPFDW